MMSPRKIGWSFGFAAMVVISLTCICALAIGAELKFSECPAAVQKTFQREANGVKIEEVDEEVEDGRTTYEADVTIDGKEYVITVTVDGILLEKSLEDEEEDDGPKGETVEVKLADCPAAVQTTLKREANGADIETVDKETKDGKAIYEINVKNDDKNYEIRVTEDGILISKALDEEDE